MCAMGRQRKCRQSGCRGRGCRLPVHTLDLIYPLAHVVESPSAPTWCGQSGCRGRGCRLPGQVLKVRTDVGGHAIIVEGQRVLCHGLPQQDVKLGLGDAAVAVGISLAQHLLGLYGRGGKARKVKGLNLDLEMWLLPMESAPSNICFACMGIEWQRGAASRQGTGAESGIQVEVRVLPSTRASISNCLACMLEGGWWRVRGALPTDVKERAFPWPLPTSTPCLLPAHRCRLSLHC